MVNYLALGAGMQGTAGVYDLIRHGEAGSLTWVDSDAQRLERAAERVLRLTGFARLQTAVADASTHPGRNKLKQLFAGAPTCFNALPYRYSMAITNLALEAGSHYVDLGGNTQIARDQLRLAAEHEQGRALCVLPDCGLQPGMGNLFAAYCLEELGSCDSIHIRCGGLPQTPRPPLDYMLLFAVEGLTNEYFGKAAVLRAGERIEIDTFTELEEVEFKGLRPCEAFITSGGLSTTPWTFQGRVANLDYKTVRYRGHHARFKLLLDLGLLDIEPVAVGVQSVAPRELLHTLLRLKLSFPGEKDLAVLRCEAVDAARQRRLRLEIRDFHEDATGFSAMERTTAFSAAACAYAAATGRAKAGKPLEAAVDPRWFVAALEQRGIQVEIERGQVASAQARS